MPSKSPVAKPKKATTEAPSAKKQGVPGQLPLATFTPFDHYQKIAHQLRAILDDRWHKTQQEDRQTSARRVHYLSMEFLMGRALTNAIAALGKQEEIANLLPTANFDFDHLQAQEGDAALGNGGLGRLAACYLDSLAALGVASFGYGLRYEYGMFAQSIKDGQQDEYPDHWLKWGSPWEFVRPHLRYPVRFGGHITNSPFGRSQHQWQADETVWAVAYDFVVPAHHGHRVSTLRQWKAHLDFPLDYGLFCRGNQVKSADARLQIERLNWFLYPDDSTPEGRELRLRQEYFLVSASLQDMIGRHIEEHGTIQSLADKSVVHLNDTHPALAIPELMRLLMDDYGLEWADAYSLCEKIMSYTNHTLLPEALETWSVHLFERLLPRHLDIIYGLNTHFLNQVRHQFPGDEGLIQRLSLIEEHGERRIRMAHLSILMSHCVNGVSALHSELMVKTIFADFAKVSPHRFTNVTNGITHRRWVIQCNSALTSLLNQTLGSSWQSNLQDLQKLLAVRDLQKLKKSLLVAKNINKQRVADFVQKNLGIFIHTQSIFDVHIKRIHEYKRQLLNIMQVVARYHAILEHPEQNWQPKTVFFSGKAASAYVAAKTIIRLIHDVAKVINADPRVSDCLKVVFIPNYSVSVAEILIPGADLSEQISTAGTEASGTGNMKFALNGALTMGTWDGANIEMANSIGKEYMFIFGLNADEVMLHKNQGYSPSSFIASSPRLAGVIRAIGQGEFSPQEPSRYRGLMDSLLYHDTYMICADFEAYWHAQRQADLLYSDPDRWGEAIIHNIAGMGNFSSDRAIAHYAEHIWKVPFKLPTQE